MIFDFGEVLSYPPPAQTIADMADLLRLPPERFREYDYAERHGYDRGELSAEQYWLAVARDAEVRLSAEQIEWLRGKMEDAVKELRRSIELDPSQPDAYLELSQLYKKAGNNVESREAIREYLRFMPQNIQLR